MDNMINLINIALCYKYIKVVKRVNPKCSHYKEKLLYFFNFFEMRDVHLIHCGNHFMVTQITVLYT